jgi:plasmid maintenance system antidote protein VapI
MTDMLKSCLKNTSSLNAVAMATGVQKASLIRFMDGRQSLRLDIADRLAAHFDIACARRKG